ncbi:hypothetical protein F5X96DRAFT_14110 [Biscogniauxia mediterranea]|nr:hypothetical protein F5X96DRAFT_14110 [Biscogniauxia mediterranea]
MATPNQPSSGPELRTSEAAVPNHITTTTTTTTTSTNPVEAGVVDSPVSPSSTNALARFEFEMGRGNEGSKILMVEWDPSSPDGSGEEATVEDQDGWVVTWEGKETTFSLDDKDDEGGARPTKRVYFLIPSNAPVPPTVTISHPPTGRTLITKSMPAIFAPGLGVSTRDAGKRGVLHTIWAKRRLAELQEEIRKELLDNSEGIGLEMAIQERQWIIDHFGLVDPHGPPAAAAAASVERPAPPPTPQSPRSPVGGRLGEKLKGLKLATTPADLSSNHANLNSRQQQQQQQQHPVQALSPPDNNASSAVQPRPAQPGSGSAAGVASLDAVIGGGAAAPVAPSQGKEIEDELFALPMSPRSPEMKTSPFSFLK